MTHPHKPRGKSTFFHPVTKKLQNAQKFRSWPGQVKSKKDSTFATARQQSGRYLKPRGFSGFQLTDGCGGGKKEQFYFEVPVGSANPR
jgi:hypothetical protein